MLANFLYVSSKVSSECMLLGPKFNDILIDIYSFIQGAVPVLVVLLCTVDIASAVIAQDESQMKKAGTKSIKRVVIGIGIFFIPTLLDVIFWAAGVGINGCNVGSWGK